MLVRLATLVALTLLGSPAPAPRSAKPAASHAVPEAARAFAGRYVFAGGEAERNAQRRSIDAVVADVTPMLRGRAKKRLLQGNPIPSRIAIDVEGDAVTISFDGRRYTAKLSGPPVEVAGVDGRPLALTHRIEGTRLTEFFEGDRGDRYNLFHIRGKRLRMTVVVQSEALPADLVYELTFTKQ